MSAEVEQEVQSSRSVNAVPSKQQIILQGDDTSVTHVLRGTDIHVIPSVASSVSLASGRGSTSTRVTSKPISKREWDLRNPTGHIIAVSSQGRYLAYVIRGPPPGDLIRNRSEDSSSSSSGDRIRVCNRRTASKGLLSGLMGSTLDLAFSYEREQWPLLAAIDDYGCVLVVRVVENDQQSLLTFQPIVSVFPSPDPAPQPSNWRRVAWSPYVRCIDTESAPDLAQSLIVTSENRAELWRLDLIKKLAGGRQSSTEPLLLQSVTSGRFDITEHQLPITDAVLSCDGEHLIVGTTSLDGYVNFLQLDSVDEAGDGGYNVSVLQHWRPHAGRPVYSLCFLDNVEETLSTMWKYALTLSQPEPGVNSASSEIKLWHCQTWECLQTLTFQPSLQTPPVLRLQLSLSGDFAFLTDVNRAVLYLLHLEQSESTATFASLTELLLASECLDFALLKVGIKTPKINLNETDDQENVNSLLLNGSLASDPSISLLPHRSSTVTGHLIAVSPKLIHELTIRVVAPPSKPNESNSPAQQAGLSLSEIGRHLVTPDLLNRSLTKNSPGNASTLTGVTSLPLNQLNTTEPEAEQQSNRVNAASISLFPGGINLNSPQNGGAKLAASSSSVTYSPQRSTQNVAADAQNQAQKDVVGMLFEAAGRFRAAQMGQIGDQTSASQPTEGGSTTNNRSGHRPSPPPSDTSLEVADILNSGKPVGGAQSVEAVAENGLRAPENLTSSTTPQLLAPGALLGSVPETVGIANGAISSNVQAQTPVQNAMPSTTAAIELEQTQSRQLLTAELSNFRETVSTLMDGQRSIIQLLSGLQDRINQLELRQATMGSSRDSSSNLPEDPSVMSNQIGDIVGRQATTRMEALVREAISDFRDQMDATGKQAVSDVKTAVSQQVAERVHSSMDVFRHALQGVVTSRPVVDAVATATAEAATHAVTTSSRQVFTESVLPSIERSVESMLTQLGETLAQGTSQYEQRLRANLDASLSAHQSAISQQYSDIELSVSNRVESLLQHKFSELEQRSSENQKSLQTAVLRAVSDRMEVLAKQTASSVDQAVAGAVARSRPVTPAPTPVNATSIADLKNQISGFVRRSEWNAAFQTALGATDLSTLVWLCQQVPVATIFKGAGPCPLTQAVLLSFIQQMAFDLTTQSELKADWLSEAVMALDPSDPLVSRNLSQIAKGADAGIERYLAATAGQPGSTRVAKSLRMVQTIIRSLSIGSGGGGAGGINKV